MQYFFAIILPPLAVLWCGKPFQALLNLFLTLAGWIPRVLHALFVVHNHNADLRAQSLERAYYATVSQMQRHQ